MRFADFTFAFPALLSAIMLTAIYGPGLVTSIVAIGIFNIPVFARITRASANAVWAREFVLAARACGKGAFASRIEHVLPNIAAVLIVQATIQFAIAILAEAALSYLGLGTQPPQPSWGRMLNEAQTHDVPGAAAGGLARPRDRAGGARPQPAGRRAARPARSAAGAAALRRMHGRSKSGPARALQTARGPAEALRGVSFALGARRDAGAGRRVRLRQVDDRAGADGPAARGRAASRQHPLRRATSWSA